jgi:hypothetical protein
MCMDRWMLNNPARARLGNFPDTLLFSNDPNL